MAAGFAVSQIGEFVMDVSKLSGEAEGVRVAFERLPAATKLMLDLKDATSGTVSELDLMKRSVMAANFGISLKALPELLEFASIRAKQTGQSVDYLVDSIVTGIGRKSKLILDNLGISAVALGEAMGGVSMEAATVGEVAEAVGRIASENLKEMGEMSENASTKMERLGATWVNLKVAMGDAANGTGVLGTSIDILTGFMTVLASKNLSASDKLAAFSGTLGLSIALTKDSATAIGKASEEQEKANKITDTATVLLRDLGLDYEALMNVAGDNVDVLQIWAEMQRLAAPAVKETTEQTKEQIKALEELTKKLYEQAEAERMIRIAKLERSLTPKAQNPMDALRDNYKMEVPKMNTDAITSMTAALGILKGQNDLTTQSMADQQSQMIANTMAFAEMAGSILGGSDSIGQAMAMMASQVVDAVGKMIMAQMIQKAIQDKATDFNFFAKLAVVGLAVSTASALLRKIGKSGGGGGISGGGGGGSGGSGGYGSRQESMGQRIELSFSGDAGKVLKAMTIKQDRIDSRTRS